jgi:hypothetical protein
VPTTSSLPADGCAASLQDEARRLLAAARAEDLPLRLLGGMGIRLLLGSRLDPRLRREVADLDFITTRRAGAAVERLIAAQGWEPRRRFNAVHGARRLLFDEPAGGTRHIDVFVGGFRMCHPLPLLDHLEERDETLPATELLLSKLQIVTLNAKDRGDLYALLLGCDVGAGGGEADGRAEPDDARLSVIESPRIAGLAAADWGLFHTIELNLARLREGLDLAGLDAGPRERIATQIDALAAALEATPKSRGWRLRARVGERRRWYEDPEEVAR